MKDRLLPASCRPYRVHFEESTIGIDILIVDFFFVIIQAVMMRKVNKCWYFQNIKNWHKSCITNLVIAEEDI